MDSPLVTVGIPTYNRPSGLRKTLECITKQTYLNLQIIISDNCSDNPDVLNILREFAAADKRITYFVQEKNISIVPNFRFLLNNASGKYFMWAADDDQWDKNFIKTTVEILENNPDVVLCMTDVDFIYEDGTTKKSRLDRGFIHKNVYSRSFNFTKSNTECKYFFCGLYRTSSVKNIPFDNSWGGDHLFVYETLTKGKLYHCKGFTGFYYFRGGSSKGMESVRKAFGIKSRYYFFEAYILRYTTYQFRFKHLGFPVKLGLFFSNWLGLILNEDFILYYIFIKKPIRLLRNHFTTKKT